MIKLVEQDGFRRLAHQIHRKDGICRSGNVSILQDSRIREDNDLSLAHLKARGNRVRILFGIEDGHESDRALREIFEDLQVFARELKF